MKNVVILVIFVVVVTSGVLIYQRTAVNQTEIINTRLSTHRQDVLQQIPPPLQTNPRIFQPIAVEGLEIKSEDVEYSKKLCIPSYQPSISLLAHELRLWGLSQSFSNYPQSRCSDSHKILIALTDARVAAEISSREGKSKYLAHSEYGLHVALIGRDCSIEELGEAHFGHLAASFGAAGVTLEQTMFTSDGKQFTVRDYVNDLCFQYAPNHEPEFFASAMACFLDTPYRWTNEGGEIQSPANLVRVLVSAPHGKGVCFGGHIPFALTMLLRLDESTHCLGNDDRELAESHLVDISRHLTRSQKATGTWLVWVNASRPFQYGSDIIDRISVTGHHLEWIALAPANLRPKPAVIRRAVAGLIHDLHRIAPEDQQKNKFRLPLTHAARALALLSQPAGGPATGSKL